MILSEKKLIYLELFQCWGNVNIEAAQSQKDLKAHNFMEKKNLT